LRSGAETKVKELSQQLKQVKNERLKDIGEMGSLRGELVKAQNKAYEQNNFKDQMKLLVVEK